MFIDCKWVDTRWQWRNPVAVETAGGSGDTRWQLFPSSRNVPPKL